MITTIGPRLHWSRFEPAMEIVVQFVWPRPWVNDILRVRLGLWRLRLRFYVIRAEDSR